MLFAKSQRNRPGMFKFVHTTNGSGEPLRTRGTGCSNLRCPSLELPLTKPPAGTPYALGSSTPHSNSIINRENGLGNNRSSCYVPKAESETGNFCVNVIKQVITDCAPHTMVVDFQTSFVRQPASSQPHWHSKASKQASLFSQIIYT